MSNRTHNNGELRLSDVGKVVTLIGWVSKKRNLGSLVFIDLRDRYGYTQIVVNEESELVKSIRNEYIIEVTGKVIERESKNNKLPTGEIEVVAENISIINTSKLTPFIIADETDALEDTRLKYRYLDLRRPIMQNYLIKRSKICTATRDYLNSLDFIEVETPILCLSSPEGARDYLVPSRVKQGSFYALPQSPQLFKQLLMVGGLEKYYQIARCFRDEDLRADRQPDFTQIDIETSFMNQDEIFTLLEGLIAKIFKDVNNYEVKLPLRRIAYKDAIDTYGSDKPDTRFDMKLIDLNFLKVSGPESFMNAESVKGIVVKGVASSTSRKVLDKLSLLSKKYRINAYIALKYVNSTLEGSFAKFFDDELKAELINKTGLEENDVLFFCDGKYKNVTSALGALRNHYAKELNLIDKNSHDLLWIVDFPLFQKDEETGAYSSEHHPFTRPRDEDLVYLDSDPLKVLGQCYDMVIDGYETLSGSLRIYNQDVQHKIFEILGLSEEQIKAKFGYFIDALQYGTPPHGGGAFGLDRLTMILSGTENIRDVIAFPKNLSATCPMSNAPMPVDEQQLLDLGIEVKIKE